MDTHAGTSPGGAAAASAAAFRLTDEQVALRDAVRIEVAGGGVPSTKGVL